MQKNDIFEMEITDIGVNGEGIGKIDGYTLFVKDAIIGDVIEVKLVKAKKNYGYGRLMKILTPSPDRVIPLCPVARKCGGCQIQEMSYKKQLEFKEKKVRNNLTHIGEVPEELLDNTMDSTAGMEESASLGAPFYYRNKAQFPIGADKNGNPIAGFYAGRTHSIISNTRCVLGAEVNEKILNLILDFMKEYKIKPYNEKTHAGVIRHVLIRYGFRTKEIMVCLVVNADGIPYSDVLSERLSGIKGMTSITMNVNKDRTNVILGEEIKLIWGKEYITDYIGDVKYQISPLSFYQVNPVQTEKLYRTVMEYAGLDIMPDAVKEAGGEEKKEETECEGEGIEGEEMLRCEGERIVGEEKLRCEGEGIAGEEKLRCEGEEIAREETAGEGKLRCEGEEIAGKETAGKEKLRCEGEEIAGEKTAGEGKLRCEGEEIAGGKREEVTGKEPEKKEKEIRGEKTVVWDLYCGIGTISLFLAKKGGQVYGVEVVPQAIENARNNARINGIENVEFFAGKAEEVLPGYYEEYERTHGGEKAHADVIVVDPPRKGCEEVLLKTMVNMRPERIVYVSCDSATLARDVKVLRENGYELEKVRVVDQFPHTVHVETCVLLGRK